MNLENYTKTITGLLIIVLILFSGCSQKKEYVCSTGEIVSSSSKCPEVCGNDICSQEEAKGICHIDCDVETRKGEVPNCKGGILLNYKCQWADVPQN